MQVRYQTAPRSDTDLVLLGGTRRWGRAPPAYDTELCRRSQSGGLKRLCWNKLKTRSLPFNGKIESQNGETRISAAVEPPGSVTDARVRYGLEVTREGVQTQEAMARSSAAESSSGLRARSAPV